MKIIKIYDIIFITGGGTIKNLFMHKHNQQDSNIPTYILFFMACYVIWQMGIVWIDANNSIITSANITNNNFISNLTAICGIASIMAMIIFIVKPNYAYKGCKIFSIISLIATVFLLSNNYIEICLYILVTSCSILSLASIVIYIYTYNSKNLKKQIFFEMLGVGIVSLIFHNDIFKINFTFYNIIAIILLSLFIVGLYKITDIDIKKVVPIKKENNKVFYLGMLILLLIFNIVATFGGNIVSQIKYGTTLFFIGHLVGTLQYYILNKIRIKKSYIPSLYIALFIFTLAIIYISSINLFTSFLLGICNSMFFAIIYYGNLAYKSTLSNKIYIVFNTLGIVQVLLMDFLLNITNNNIDILISIYVVISIIALAVLSIINKELNDRIDKMLKIEIKETIFLPLSDSEKVIADLMLKDYSNSEIANTVYLSQNTIKFHVRSILKKLNVSNKKELIKLINN